MKYTFAKLGKCPQIIKFLIIPQNKMMEVEERNRIVTMRLNQDQSCFVCGTEKGFQVYGSNPYKDVFQRMMGGGLGVVEMLFKCNILALVGGGTHPKFPLNKVLLWDDYQTKPIGELSFKTAVKSVLLRKDKLVVVLENRVYVFNFADFQLLDVIDTFINPRGVCAITSSGDSILVCPGKAMGEVTIKNYDKSIVIEKKVHESALFSMALSSDGKLLATASAKGTLIRIFSTEDGRLLQELRRGKDKAEVNSIAFDKPSRLLACTSSRGTVHIFSIINASKAVKNSDEPLPELTSSEIEEKEEKKVVDPKNPTSIFKFMKKIVPYFRSEWSFAQFRIPERHALVGFGPEDSNQIFVVTSTGKFYIAQFDPIVGGDCKKIDEKPIILSE